MTDILTQHWPDCVVPPATLDKAVVAECKRRVGGLMTTTRYTAWVPWLPTLGFEVARPHYSHVDRRTIDLLMGVSAHANGCRHCYGAMRAVLQIMGYDERTITALQGEIQASHLDPKTKAVLEYTRFIVNADPAVAAQKQALAAQGFGALEVAELTYIAAVSAASHRINTSLAVPPDAIEKAAAAAWMRVARPLAGFLLSRKARPVPRPEPLPEATIAGPFSRIVRALDGLPGALVLRQLIDAALASEITHPRLRGFIYAVVARTIGAHYVESEAAQLLADADVPSDVVAGMLDHLHHPSLTADEAAVINYARDSVRYQVPVIQKTLRALAAGKPPELTVDIVGQVAFANTVARLDILVD